MGAARCTIVLLAGPSGAGKSRLAASSGLPCLRLDDFYRDQGASGLPRRPDGLVDWDDPASWDAEAAAAALRALAAGGEAVAPVYDLATSRRTGCRTVRRGDAPAIVAEGIFAVELAARLRAAPGGSWPFAAAPSAAAPSAAAPSGHAGAGLPAAAAPLPTSAAPASAADGPPLLALWLDRPRLATAWRRLRRDLAEQRKPPLVLAKRGWMLYRAEPRLRQAAVAAGFTPVRWREAQSRLAGLGGRA